MRTSAWFLIGGGLAALGAALFIAKKKSDNTVENLQKALTGNDGPPVPSESKGGGLFQVRSTGYWPLQEGLSKEQRLMEGGGKDRKGRPIFTLEMHQQDPVKYPYVSVAGDYTIWPDGQRIELAYWPGLIFRVVDTGGHFFGSQKIYRIASYEPLDIAVNGPSTKVPTTTTGRIIPGDHFAKKGLTEVATAGFKGQNVVLGRELGEWIDALLEYGD